MPLFKTFTARVLAAALAFSFVPAVMPSGTPVVGVSEAKAQDWRYDRHWDGGRRDYYRGGRDWDRGRYYGERRYDRDRRYDGNRRYDRDRSYHRRNNNGAAVAAGIIGLGVGAAIASANQPRYYRPAPRYYAGGGTAFRSPEWYQYCAQRYRSFDPRSGTFQPYNGPRQVCR